MTLRLVPLPGHRHERQEDVRGHKDCADHDGIERERLGRDEERHHVREEDRVARDDRERVVRRRDVRRRLAHERERNERDHAAGRGALRGAELAPAHVSHAPRRHSQPTKRRHCLRGAGRRGGRDGRQEARAELQQRSFWCCRLQDGRFQLKYYRIDFADVADISTFIGDNLSTTLAGKYSVTTEYALFVITDEDLTGLSTSEFMYDAINGYGGMQGAGSVAVIFKILSFASIKTLDKIGKVLRLSITF